MRFVSTVLGVVELSSLFFFFFKQKTAYEMRISDWEFRRVLFRSPAEIGPEFQAELQRGVHRFSARARHRPARGRSVQLLDQHVCARRSRRLRGADASGPFATRSHLPSRRLPALADPRRACCAGHRGRVIALARFTLLPNHPPPHWSTN